MAKSDRKHRILLVGGAGNLSGVPRHIVQLSLALRATHEITVASDRDEGGFTALHQNGIEHRIIPGLRSRINPIYLIIAWLRLIQVLRHQSTELVWLHARLALILGRLALALRIWCPTAPVAITFHGLPFGKGHHPVASFVAVWLETLLLRACPPLHVIFLTEEMQRRMQHTIGTGPFAKHHLHVLPNCSDLGTLPEPMRTNTKRIVMTVRTGRQKDILTAVRTFARLPSDFTLHLCGPGTDNPKFIRNIRAQIPQAAFQRITFLGLVPDVRPQLASADAYLLSSRYEGLPIGALEAFEAGLPIILRDFDGATELVADHPMALVMPFENPAQDATKITDLVTQYQANRAPYARDIRDVWQQRWTPEIFAANAGQLVHRITKKAA